MPKNATTTETVTVPDTTATVTDEAGKTEVLHGSAARKAIDAALDAPPTPASLREVAEDLPEKDEVQKATKAAMLASDPAEEVREKVKAVKASPDAEDTPSGGAMIKVAGIASHTERGEKYRRIKSALRWGTITIDEIK